MNIRTLHQRPGAMFNSDKSCDFRVWAPHARQVTLHAGYPEPVEIEMAREKYGCWYIKVHDCPPGTLYKFRVGDNEPLPDPASLSQPHGVHGPSEVMDLNGFRWTDKGWSNIPLSEMIIYELHTGTFSKTEDFDGIGQRLDYLLNLGINTIEIMPVGQFPGKRNWGYDGVYFYAVQNSYGGSEGLMKLVDLCHSRNIAVILDVVYNHLGPEGNYLGIYGPYFTDRYNTPWGQAINYDDKYADGARSFVLHNAVTWMVYFHIDALRLDAVHAIYDFSARHIMQELSETVEKVNKVTGYRHYLIAESALNDSRYINRISIGGYGIDAQWNDDFHHGLHTVSTGETQGYYVDFKDPEMLARSFMNGYAYEGRYSEFRKRRFGNSSRLNEGHQFIVFSQNHDQVGNRKSGERLSSLVSFDLLKVIAAAVFLSPFVPMIFMGEEYGEKAPFLYFVDHGDKKLNKLVREGRQNEFKSFYSGKEYLPPDPADPETFEKSRLDFDGPLRDRRSLALYSFYKKLMELRKITTALNRSDRKNISVSYEERFFTILRWDRESTAIAWLNFGNTDVDAGLPPEFTGSAVLILDSSDREWGGPGSHAAGKLSPGNSVIVQKESVILYTANLKMSHGRKSEGRY